MTHPDCQRWKCAERGIDYGERGTHVFKCELAPDDAPTCCGQGTAWNDMWMGRTCGGLDIEGAWVCAKCGKGSIGKRTREREGPWRVSHGGRSLDAGGTRLRAEKCQEPERLFARIVKVPAMEAALRAIADGAPNARELAMAAMKDEDEVTP